MKTDKSVRGKYRWGVIKYNKHEKETYQSREQNRRPEIKRRKDSSPRGQKPNGDDELGEH